MNDNARLIGNVSAGTTGSGQQLAEHTDDDEGAAPAARGGRSPNRRADHRGATTDLGRPDKMAERQSRPVAPSALNAAITSAAAVDMAFDRSWPRPDARPTNRAARPDQRQETG